MSSFLFYYTWQPLLWTILPCFFLGKEFECEEGWICETADQTQLWRCSLRAHQPWITVQRCHGWSSRLQSSSSFEPKSSCEPKPGFEPKSGLEPKSSCEPCSSLEPRSSLEPGSWLWPADLEIPLQRGEPGTIKKPLDLFLYGWIWCPQKDIFLFTHIYQIAWKSVYDNIKCSLLTYD